MNTHMIPNLAKRTVKMMTVGSLAAVAGMAYGQSFSDVLEGLKEGSKASLDARARYEYNDTPTSEVNGYSIRTRLALTTGEYEGFQALVEMEDVSFANNDDRPALDVPTTELNRIWLSYGGAKLGRQLVAWDDQRFIGHVGWRQNIQTFDAITYGVDVADNTALKFGYLDAVHRVNATSQDLTGLLVNSATKFGSDFTLNAFAYMLDFDRMVLASSDTYGIRGVGKIPGDEISYNYSFSYAKQVDNSGSPTDFDLDYYAGEFGASFAGMSLAAGLEVLDGDGVTGFTTPLATVHKFNGFADAFAGSSLGLGGGLPEGLEDYYVVFGFKAGDVPIKVFYHSFDAANVSDYLGSEIDVVASYKLNDYVTLIGKFADYSSDGAENVTYGGVDKQVLTVEANLKF
ncbi:alginate export family protein [Pelagicoccus mobilis]|uniref:Alginate export family protein n=1 Tax=Pelagicoccus mobilis TaxID=415221 RepID=A0A934RVQ8_9BACT|nr:alginate export family protein [Pelagicoccus mobilis]MBK1877361.1 alginate export family protein [Pelagicoccus mobilis]